MRTIIFLSILLKSFMAFSADLGHGRLSEIEKEVLLEQCLLSDTFEKLYACFDKHELDKEKITPIRKIGNHEGDV